MIKIYNKATNEMLGRISEEDLKFLNEHLEEESLKDQDYYLTKQTVEEFAANGASLKLLEILRMAFPTRDETEIRWERDDVSR